MVFVIFKVYKPSWIRVSMEMLHQKQSVVLEILKTHHTALNQMGKTRMK